MSWKITGRRGGLPSAIVAIVLVWGGVSRLQAWEPATCAEAFFERVLHEKSAPRRTTAPPGAGVRVVPTAIPGADLLPVKVFEAVSTETGPPLMAWFALGDKGTCGLIGGDLDRLIGHSMDREERVAWGLEQFNRCLDPGKAVASPGGKDRADNVLAVLSAVSAPGRVVPIRPSRTGGVEVMGTGERLQGLPGSVIQQVQEPVVHHGGRIDRAVLFTWESPPDAIMRNEAYVWSNGKMSVFREAIGARADEERVSVASH